MTLPEFVAYPKTPRWFRDVTITEKIDGTNAGIHIRPYPFGTHVDGVPDNCLVALGANGEDGMPELEYVVMAQSRNRVITPNSDNQGFAAWVWANARTLVTDLGPGLHFGEWWGLGIQRRYNQKVKRFSLFNAHRWQGAEFTTPRMDSVPILYTGPLQDTSVEVILDGLRQLGSVAAPDFMQPEGLIVYHTAAKQSFKALLDNDDAPKGALKAKGQVA